ncbi:MAG: ELM1/GtrOC1 family putative glycosyltransferase [Pseudomonadota bacterium]
MTDGENATGASRRARRVWVVGDGVPGHEARSRGALAALARLGRVEAVPLTGALRGRLARAGLIAAYALLNRPPAGPVLRTHGATQPAGTPDLVLGAGGRTQFLTLALAERFSVPSLFAGRPRHLDGNRFTAVIAPYPVPGLANLIELEVPLSDVEPAMAQAAGAALRAKAGAAPVWSLLAGGDGGGYRMQPAEWRVLGRWLGAKASAAGARLCVTTSRRTGAASEAALAGALAGALGTTPLLERRFWGDGARGGTLALIGAADLVFTTADSATMIGEAVASARPVIVLNPASKRPALRHAQVLDGLSSRRRIKILDIAALDTAKLDAGKLDAGKLDAGLDADLESGLKADLQAGLQPLARSPIDGLAEALAHRLTGSTPPRA